MRDNECPAYFVRNRSADTWTVEGVTFPPGVAPVYSRSQALRGALENYDWAEIIPVSQAEPEVLESFGLIEERAAPEEAPAPRPRRKRARQTRRKRQ